MKASSFCQGNQRQRDNIYFYSKVREYSFVKPRFQVQNFRTDADKENIFWNILSQKLVRKNGFRNEQG